MIRTSFPVLADWTGAAHWAKATKMGWQWDHQSSFGILRLEHWKEWSGWHMESQAEKSHSGAHVKDEQIEAASWVGGGRKTWGLDSPRMSPLPSSQEIQQFLCHWFPKVFLYSVSSLFTLNQPRIHEGVQGTKSKERKDRLRSGLAGLSRHPQWTDRNGGG